MIPTTDHDRLRTLGRGMILTGAATVAVGIGVELLGISTDLKSGYLGLAGLALLTVGGLLYLPLTQNLLLEAFPPESPERPGRILLVSIWVGLLAGLVELAVLAIQYHFGHRWGGFASLDGAITPLSYAGLLLLPAAAVALWAHRGSPRLGSLRFAVFAGTWLAGVSLLLLYHPELHILVVPLLAAGVAARTGSMAYRHREGFVRLVRRSTLPLLLGVAMLGAAPGVLAHLAEGRARAALVPTESGAPNVLLIVWDTVRAANLSLHGYDRRTTPNLERLASAGVTFEHALSTTSWTLPAHASLFTGLDPSELDIAWDEPLGKGPRTLAAILRERGYLTAGLTANWIYTGPHSGLARGFQHYDAEEISPWTLVLGTRLVRWATSLTRPEPERPLASGPPSRTIRYSLHPSLGLKTAATVTNEFLDWVEQTGPRPFFAFLNYFEAHTPYYPPPPFDRLFDSSDAPLPPIHPEKGIPLDGWTGIELYSQYDGAITSIDHELGRLLKELEAQGRLENTLVIVTSDHGEEFGENGVFQHGRSLYLPSIHVPLVMALPGRVPAGRRVSAPVTLRDVPATILDLIRLQDQEAFPGRSLVPHWNVRSSRGSPAGEALYSGLKGRSWLPQDWGPVTRGDMVSLVADGFHYIQNGDGTVELYDIERDPWEFHDLAKLPDTRVQLQAFEASLDGIRSD